MSTKTDAFAALLTLLETKQKTSDFENKILDSVKLITDSSKESATIRDAYGNSLLEVGTDDKIAKLNTYGFSNDTLNWPLWLALYNDDWVFKRAIDKPAIDEIRCGVSIQNTDKSKTVYKELKNYRDDLIQLLQWGALFGGSIAVAMFDNFKDEDYARPINMLKVKQSKVMKFYVVDRWYGVAPTYDDTVTDMTSQDYGKPKYYRVSFADKHELIIHHDYILRYEHRTAPKLVKNGMLQGWGYCEGSHILNELSRDEKLKSSIQSLVDKSLIEVIKMSGMRGVFMGADADNEEQLKKRLEMVNWARNFNSLTFLDKDDDYTEHTFPGLGGLSDLLQQNMWQISSALEMQGVLFGDMKNGFSVDTDALERYDDVINGRCESYVRPVMTKLLGLIYTRLGIHEKPEFTFNSLLTKKKDKEKMEGLKEFQSLLSSVLNDGIITPRQYAKSLQSYTTKGEVSLDFTDEELNKLDDDLGPQSEDFDLMTETSSNEAMNIGK